jgi:hypothetical protein
LYQEDITDEHADALERRFINGVYLSGARRALVSEALYGMNATVHRDAGNGTKDPMFKLTTSWCTGSPISLHSFTTKKRTVFEGEGNRSVLAGRFEEIWGDTRNGSFRASTSHSQVFQHLHPLCKARWKFFAWLAVGDQPVASEFM